MEVARRWTNDRGMRGNTSVAGAISQSIQLVSRTGVQSAMPPLDRWQVSLTASQEISHVVLTYRTIRGKATMMAPRTMKGRSLGGVRNRRACFSRFTASPAPHSPAHRTEIQCNLPGLLKLTELCCIRRMVEWPMARNCSSGCDYRHSICARTSTGSGHK